MLKLLDQAVDRVRQGRTTELGRSQRGRNEVGTGVAAELSEQVKALLGFLRAVLDFERERRHFAGHFCCKLPHCVEAGYHVRVDR